MITLSISIQHFTREISQCNKAKKKKKIRGIELERKKLIVFISESPGHVLSNL